MANAKILRFLPAIRPIFMILIAEGKSQQYLREACPLCPPVDGVFP